MTVPQAEIAEVQQLGPFSFRWPHGEEHFEGGWTYVVAVDGDTHRVRHGIGSRDVYGRPRVHTVTWLDGEVQVEGVEADDYPTTRALLSLLRHPDKRHVRALTEALPGYEGFELVEHRREIDAKYSFYSIAAKIREDDLASWGTHAWLRMRQRTTQPPPQRRFPEQPPAPVLPPPPTLERRRVAEALLAHGRALAAAIGGDTARFTPDDDANALLYRDPFAFLVGVVCDQGIVAERAWAIPYELKRRLGHLEPGRVAADPAAVRAAFAEPPKLHRFVNNVPDWVARAGAIVEDERRRRVAHLGRQAGGGRTAAPSRRLPGHRTEEGRDGRRDPGARPARRGGRSVGR